MTILNAVGAFPAKLADQSLKRGVFRSFTGLSESPNLIKPLLRMIRCLGQAHRGARQIWTARFRCPRPDPVNQKSFLAPLNNLRSGAPTVARAFLHLGHWS